MKVDGRKIKELREIQELSQEALALAADRSSRWVQEVEKGTLVNINLNIAKALAARLRCKLEIIAG